MWRLSTEFDSEDSSVLPTSFPPDERQNRAYQNSWGGLNHGTFKPWALLHAPLPTRAFRFVYPSLLTVGDSNAYVWDIPSATLIQTVSDTNRPIDAIDPGSIEYAELDNKYVIICFERAIRLFSRENCGGVLLYSIDYGKLLRDYGWHLVLTAQRNNASTPQPMGESEQGLALQPLSVVQGRGNIIGGFSGGG